MEKKRRVTCRLHDLLLLTLTLITWLRSCLSTQRDIASLLLFPCYLHCVLCKEATVGSLQLRGRELFSTSLARRRERASISINYLEFFCARAKHFDCEVSFPPSQSSINVRSVKLLSHKLSGTRLVVGHANSHYVTFLCPHELYRGEPGSVLYLN